MIEVIKMRKNAERRQQAGSLLSERRVNNDYLILLESLFSLFTYI